MMKIYTEFSCSTEDGVINILGRSFQETIAGAKEREKLKIDS